MARFGRRLFKRMRVTTATRRGNAFTGKPAKVYIKKPSISAAKLKR